MSFCLITAIIFIVFLIIGYASGDNLSGFNRCSEKAYHTVWTDTSEEEKKKKKKQMEEMQLLNEISRRTMEDSERTCLEAQHELEKITERASRIHVDHFGC